MKQFISILFVVISPFLLLAQGTLTDYQRAAEMKEKLRHKLYHEPAGIVWGAEEHFFYKTLTPQGEQFYLVDAKNHNKRLLFDPAPFVTALAAQSGQQVDANSLPITN